jgi:hypothetical protein
MNLNFIRVKFKTALSGNSGRVPEKGKQIIKMLRIIYSAHLLPLSNSLSHSLLFDTANQPTLSYMEN